MHPAIASNTLPLSPPNSAGSNRVLPTNLLSQGSHGNPSAVEARSIFTHDARCDVANPHKKLTNPPGFAIEAQESPKPINNVFKGATIQRAITPARLSSIGGGGKSPNVDGRRESS